MSVNLQNYNNNLSFKAQGAAKPQESAQEPAPIKPQKQVMKPGLPATTIIGGSLASSAALGAIGAFAFAGPKYSSVEALMDSPDAKSIIDKIGTKEGKEAQALKDAYLEVQDNLKRYQAKMDKLSTTDSILATDYKTKMTGYDTHVSEASKYEKVKDVFKAMTEGNTTLDDINQKINTATTTADDDILKLVKEVLEEKHPEIKADTANTFKLEKTTIDSFTGCFEGEMNHHKSYISEIDDFVKSAADGKFKKSDLFATQKKMNWMEIFEGTTQEVKVKAYDAIEKLLPKNRVKPGVIGAVTGLLAVGAALFTYSKLSSTPVE